MFAPVARMSSTSRVTALAAQYGMKIKHLDVTTAYLNEELEESIFMQVTDYTEQSIEKNILSKSKTSIIKKKKKPKRCFVTFNREIRYAT